MILSRSSSSSLSLTLRLLSTPCKQTTKTVINARQQFKSFTTSTSTMSPIATTTTSSSSSPTSSSSPSKATLPPSILQACLDSNAEWAQAVTNAEPGFFEASAKGQAPGVLWFGCSDSRVPESVVLARRPGDIFVHRNIANQFHASDDSAHAVLSYAISVLGVRQVIVVGHSSCGGCFAAHGSAKPVELKEGEKDESDALTRFLRPLIHLRHTLPEEATMDDLIVANVKQGVKNIAETEVVRDQWERAEKSGGEGVQIHGWFYDVSKGRMSDLGCSQALPAPLEAEAVKA